MLAFVSDPIGALLVSLLVVGAVVFILAPFVALQFVVWTVLGWLFPFPKDELLRLRPSSAACPSRCAFCHDDFQEAEPSVVACPRCGTQLHEVCWKDAGRCPVLGCAARSAPGRERGGRALP
ncbi:hypothetical protein HY251_14460 [bacterium]|nr:hypothetical protein [bacterium]